MKSKNLYSLLLGTSAVLFILSIITLLPNAGASSPNILGYKSVCSFSPVSTVIFFWLTAAVCTVRARIKDEDKKGTPAAFIVLSLIFAVGIAFYSIQYAHAKDSFSRIIRGTSISGKMIPPSGEYRSNYSSDEISADVSVEVKDGKISVIRLNSGKNIEKQVSEEVFSRIIAAQNPEVDSVSGASASSLVLMKAVEKALSQSK